MPATPLPERDWRQEATDALEDLKSARNTRPRDVDDERAAEARMNDALERGAGLP